jgi:hypothetical protein
LLTLGITADSFLALAYLLSCFGQISQLLIGQNDAVVSMIMLAGSNKRISDE